VSLRSLVRLALRTGRTAEPAPAAPAEAGGTFAGSVQVRHVDAGSCNGCEIELGAAFGPVYDAERYGARLVASPRHADVVLVTGAVTRNMAEPLRLTTEATPEPRLVVAMGDCARGCGPFRGGYGLASQTGAAAEVVPVDLEIPGCPPEPAAVVEALRRVTGR
jgi:Ni,Fe-hydrogenase III small subunit